MNSRIAPPPVVAFQGEAGAYSDEALSRVFPHAQRVPCPVLRDVFDAVGAKATHGIVPVENSYAGSINETYDLLLAYPHVIVGEITHAVDHCLLALPGETLETLRRVRSHPQALSQCEVFLRERRLEGIADLDTAGAARRVSEQATRGTAAIAGRRAAKLYGLNILAESIQSVPRNITRFLILAPLGADVRGAGKTSIVFATANVPGALYRALGVFASRALNLSKLESRPARERGTARTQISDFEYVFYVDVEADAASAAMREALDELREQSTFVRVLGSYPKDESAGQALPRG